MSVSKDKKVKIGNDAIGRDRSISASNGSVVVGGNMTGSTIITGNNNIVGSSVFEPIYREIEKSSLPDADKQDLKSEVTDVETELNKGDQADESFLARHLRNIQRMSPDILEVVVSTLANPLAGLGTVAAKVAEKMRAEAKK